MIPILETPAKECACERCKQMCLRPCWPTPAEAVALIDAGLGHKLMLDYWAAEDDIELLCPAIRGYENQGAPFFPKGKCTFLNAQGLCDLHDKGLKPIEGRLADCKNPSGGQLHKAVADLWNTEEGRAVIARWR